MTQEELDARGLRVKPLVWVETNNGYRSANGYVVKADKCSRNRYYVLGPIGEDVFSANQAIYNLNPLTGREAKAAAQVHYEACVLAMIEVME